MFDNPDRKRPRPSEQLGEEARNLLRKIVERQAYRQLMLANIRGHGMKLVPEIDEKILLAQDIEHSLRVLQQVELLYAELGGNELALVVRDKMERIPYPATRLELAMCLSLCDRAERVTAESYVDSHSGEFAAITLSLLAMDKTSARRGEETLVRFCAEPGNRPAAQQMFQRWLSVVLIAMGRPGTRGDARAVELGLRTKRCAESVKQLVEELQPLMSACHLLLPSAAAMGLELPPELAAAAGT